MEHMLETAIQAAKEAGEILKRYFETSLERRLKDDSSIVTEADERAEERIIEVIKAQYPDHGFLGEETGEQNADAEYIWIIDPLDGTRNFVNGIPIFAVSIGLVRSGKPVAGVIYNPVTDTLFAGEEGRGAYWNGKQIHVSDREAKAATFTIGTSAKAEDKNLVAQCFLRAESHVRGVRYLGSAVMDLGYMARGGTEGCIHIGTKKWDYAAGALLVLEAGGTITDFDGNPWDMEKNYFIASNGKIHSQLLDLVKSARV